MTALPTVRARLVTPRRALAGAALVMVLAASALAATRVFCAVLWTDVSR